MPDGPYEHVAGHRFPGGTTVVPAWMNRLWCDAVTAEDTAPHVHPMLVYYAAVQGSGVDFQAIFDLFEGSADSGVMVGEQKLDFRAPLEVEREYLVDGGITDVVRKSGRRAGVFDIATFELRLRDAGDADPVATSTTSFVFPRRDEVAA
ncbi:MAG: hypothetical protein JWQ20_356 [Conexibacter sp.]|nr:hypothetical protein [Conexibacter sp.]